MINQDSIDRFKELSKKIFEEIKKDVIGQDEVIENVVIALISGGNVLLEGVPGVGKTRLVRSLSRVFDMPFSRIQFTPDLMPQDVTGTNIIIKDKEGNSKFKFEQGPIFSNIVLADEKNRATPKTQSALLEAMQEQTVTVMGKTYKLNEPFFVLATQNPIEQDGTYPLPEAQMDRFMFKINVAQPSLKELCDIVNLTQKTMKETANSVINSSSLLEMKEIAKEILISNTLFEYAMKLCLSINGDSEIKTEVANKYILQGASPRAAQALISASKVRALLKGRYNVSEEDINSLAFSVLRHRIKLNFLALSENITQDDVIKNY